MKFIKQINAIAVYVLFPIALCILLGIGLLLIDRAATNYDKNPDAADGQVFSK